MVSHTSLYLLSGVDPGLSMEVGWGDLVGGRPLGEGTVWKGFCRFFGKTAWNQDGGEGGMLYLLYLHTFSIKTKTEICQAYIMLKILDVYCCIAEFLHVLK